MKGIISLLPVFFFQRTGVALWKFNISTSDTFLLLFGTDKPHERTYFIYLQDSDIERHIQWRRWPAEGIMILPSSQKSSVIKPSQPKMAAVGDPHGGEIPMELYAIAVWCVPCRRASRINSDNRIAWKLELSTNDWYYPDSRRFFVFFCRGI